MKNALAGVNRGGVGETGNELDNSNPTLALRAFQSSSARPPSWEPFYQLRESGEIPAGGYVRVTLSPGLVVAAAMEIPEGVNPWRLDLSPVAGLDTFLIFDGERETFGRLTNCVGAILRSNPASLRLIDAPADYEPRWALIKRGYPRGGHADE